MFNKRSLPSISGRQPKATLLIDIVLGVTWTTLTNHSNGGFLYLGFLLVYGYCGEHCQLSGITYIYIYIHIYIEYTHNTFICIIYNSGVIIKLWFLKALLKQPWYYLSLVPPTFILTLLPQSPVNSSHLRFYISHVISPEYTTHQSTFSSESMQTITDNHNLTQFRYKQTKGNQAPPDPSTLHPMHLWLREQ